MLDLKKMIFLAALIAFSFANVYPEEGDGAENIKVPININNNKFNKVRPMNPNLKKFNNPKPRNVDLENKDEENGDKKEDEAKPAENAAQPKKNNNEVRTVTPPQPKNILDKEQPKTPDDNKLLDAVKVEINEPKAANMNLKIRLDFKDEELMNVVKLFSDLLQKNFIIPENLGKAKINLLSPQKVTVAEAYKNSTTYGSVSFELKNK